MLTRLPAVLAGALLASTLAVAGGSAAIADSETPCAAELTQLSSDLSSVPITGGKVDKERAGLLKIVGDTAALAEAGKTTDAVVKLSNLQAKVDDLAAVERISTESAELLTTDTADATLCLSSLSG
ncbi:hypothetical protein [Agromyces mariniharenae]|uniref:Secreted protein n=1 Tax=Agromyces mariniharenae TaxID=2604423 RepID=A0A5S4V0T6_9MICO|nr:hypothetical protein [Agromyces mariniharenae]TYL50921.1 hypothetical protein FYC51_17425 [Agromyces mariniharenae]